MIKKLRIKFILISMASVLLIMVAIIASINISNFVNTENDAKSKLSLIIKNAHNEEPPGPGPQPAINYLEQENNEEPPLGPQGLMGEDFFFVIYDKDGNVTKENYNHIFSISDANARAMANKLYAGKSTLGKDGDYRYKVTRGDETIVAVLDLTYHLNSANEFLRNSSLISTGGYLLAFVAVFFLSKLVLRPTEESYRKQKEFITNASHELKTPLTIISTDVEILEMDHGSSEWSNSIKDQVKKLTEMTNDLVTLSKLGEENKDNYPFLEFSFTDLLNESIESFAQSYKGAKIKLVKDIEDNVTYCGNRFLLNEVCAVMLDNALKYTTTGGEEKISLKKTPKGKIELTFSNDIDPESEVNVSKLFDRFYRSANSKTSGSGIGLSIAKEIVTMHKGKISAEIKEGKIYFYTTL